MGVILTNVDMFSLPVTMPMENFRYVMGRSSAIREMMVKVLMVTWDNLGGLENLNRELQELVQYLEKFL